MHAGAAEPPTADADGSSTFGSREPLTLRPAAPVVPNVLLLESQPSDPGCTTLNPMAADVAFGYPPAAAVNTQPDAEVVAMLFSVDVGAMNSAMPDVSVVAVAVAMSQVPLTVTIVP